MKIIYTGFTSLAFLHDSFPHPDFKTIIHYNRAQVKNSHTYTVQTCKPLETLDTILSNKLGQKDGPICCSKFVLLGFLFVCFNLLLASNEHILDCFNMLHLYCF